MIKNNIYFRQFENTASQKEISHSVYCGDDKRQIERLNSLNNFSGRNSYRYPGEFLLIPGHELHDELLPAYAEFTDQLNFEIRHGKHKPNPRYFNQSFGEFLYAQQADVGIDVVKTFVGESSAVVSKILSAIANDLKELNSAYVKMQGAARGVAFPKDAVRTTAYATERALIYARIQSKINQLPNAFKAIKPNVGSVQDALNITHSDVKRAFRAGGSAAEIKKIREVVAKAADLSKKVAENGKGVAIGLQGIGGIKTLYDYDKTVRAAKLKDPSTADIVGVRESGRGIGGVAGGFVGGELGLMAGTAVAALVLATPVGWGALAIVGIGAVAGSALGSYAGAQTGDAAAVKWMKEVDPSRSDEIDMIINAKP